MQRRTVLLAGTFLLAAVIPFSAQAQDSGSAPAPAPKAKAKHVYTDADLRPLDEKCADPAVPAEEKASCPKPPAEAKAKEQVEAKKTKKEVPIYDQYGSKIPVEPDVTT